MWVLIVATCRIRLNRPRAAAMRLLCQTTLTTCHVTSVVLLLRPYPSFSPELRPSLLAYTELREKFVLRMHAVACLHVSQALIDRWHRIAPSGMLRQISLQPGTSAPPHIPPNPESTHSTSPGGTTRLALYAEVGSRRLLHMA